MSATLQQPDKGETLIVGLGKSGLSTARFLAARGIPFAVTDSRTDPPGLEALHTEHPAIDCRTGGFDEALFARASRLILSPGVALSEPMVARAVARGAEVLGDIELFARAVEAPLGAITGSNGKSTVTVLLNEMARAAGRSVAAGGNLGEPALDLLPSQPELFVLELSSFQLETTHTLKARAATVLNISPDHQDRYPDLVAYTRAKERIYHNAEVRIFNRDDPVVMALQGAPQPGDRSFGLDEAVSPEDFGITHIAGSAWLCKGATPWIEATALQIPGRHNLANALAALTMGDSLGLERKAMVSTLRTFSGLPHRTQLVAEIAGVRWYNDSKGTNVGACAAALEGFADGPGRTLLIAGGDGKGADFADLGAVIAQRVAHLILLGESANAIAAAVQGTIPLTFASDLDEAVTMAASAAVPGDRVLLSPACASFDMFASYEQRGDRFVDAVERLAA